MKKNKTKAAHSAVSRRNFLATAGVGAFGVSVLNPETEVLAANTPAAASKTQEDRQEEATSEKTLPLTLRVNGQKHHLTIDPRHTLLFVLREKLFLTGTKPGCERGECGACTVLINGVPRYSCMTLALEAENCEVTTIEGLMVEGKPGPVQKAFIEKDGFQCGFCTPGQVMAAEGLLRKNPNPQMEEIRLGMSGNLCRCGAYPHIFESVQLAVKLKKGRN